MMDGASRQVIIDADSVNTSHVAAIVIYRFLISLNFMTNQSHATFNTRIMKQNKLIVILPKT